MGGESDFGQGTSGDKAGYLLFTGPIQYNPKEEANTISFEVEKNKTLVRFYAEETGIVLALKGEVNGHSQTITGGQASIMHTLDVGHYTVHFGHSTKQAKTSAIVRPPRIQLTIMISDPEVR